MIRSGYESSDVSASGFSDDDDSLAFEDPDSDNKSISASSTKANGLDDDFEVKAVMCFRLFILFVMVSAMAAAGGYTWVLTNDNENADFKAKYDTAAFDVIDESDHESNTFTIGLESMSTTVTALSISSSAEWPYFTNANLNTLGNKFFESSITPLVLVSPVVSHTMKADWEGYSVNFQKLLWNGHPPPNDSISESIYRRDDSGQPVLEDSSNLQFSPIWQVAYTTTKLQDLQPVINFNLFSHSDYFVHWEKAKAQMETVIFDLPNATKLFGPTASEMVMDGRPTSAVVRPIVSSFNESKPTVVGGLVSLISWDKFFQNVVQDAELHAVIQDTCNTTFTYQLGDGVVTFLGYGDFHHPGYEKFRKTKRLDHFATGRDDTCAYSLHVYPAPKFVLDSSRPAVITSIVVIILFCISIIFCLYDCAVHKRQQRILRLAARSEKIISILYPKTIRDRLFGNGDAPHSASASVASSSIQGAKKRRRGKRHKSQPQAAKYKLKTYLNEDGSTEKVDSEGTTEIYDTKPIADLFPNTTVMFGDIAGFTAWSSVREPAQVFTLLETVYHSFDGIAKRRRIFKVETVGDCYVAVTGLPEPRKDHAVAMARFSRECLEKFNDLVGRLETSLGPDTGDLNIRIGLHSGPVTAGVLRGDKSRFQLFGDTVNTAARMETTGKRDMIHISSDTADLLKAANKENWIKKRDETVVAKGKGRLQTYWLITRDASACYISVTEHSVSESSGAIDVLKPIPTVISQEFPRIELRRHGSVQPEDGLVMPPLPRKTERLVGWNVDVLARLLKQVVAKRNAMGNRRNYNSLLTNLESQMSEKTDVLDEVVEIIALPKFDHKTFARQDDPDQIELQQKVTDQLRVFVGRIAAMHPDNRFHNFEHASHVMMSVSKLLARIVTPDEVLYQDENQVTGKDIGSDLHDHTYGITSDPLTQFSVVLAALIHDVDHSGVSNFQLIKEGHDLASTYKNKSIAEQNSFVLAWSQLMSPEFVDLRRCIYAEPSEFQRFRQLLANTVLATDIFDKELNSLRKKRWEMAFHHPSEEKATTDADVNRKATIVIEHLIQASDVAHTMQHWHVYQKWNERLFHEMSVAYLRGRMEKNPADNWYQGELGFFDNYIIPLARKLKECGVFGVSSDEYLTYALENRSEWESKGKEIVAELARMQLPSNDQTIDTPIGSQLP